MFDLSTPSIVMGLFIGLLVGIIVMIVMSRLGLNRDKQRAQLILDEADAKAKNTIKQAVLDGKTQVYDLKLQAEKEIKERRTELNDFENKLLRREDSLNYRDETLNHKEKKLDEKLKKAEEKALNLEKMEEDLQSRINGQIALLERVSNMSEAEAKAELMEVVDSKRSCSIYQRQRRSCTP